MLAPAADTSRSIPRMMARPLMSLVLMVLALPSIAVGQADPIVARGVQYLKAAGGGGGAGEAALAGFALVKAEVPASDPSIARALGQVMPRFSTSAYTPQSGSGHEIYEAAVTILFLVNLDAATYKLQIEMAARFLLDRQQANGSW